MPIRFAMQSPPSAGLHVAIIMDGNGRWATQRGLPRVAGHRAGIGAVRRVVERAPEIGIRTLTLYAFSSDNWRRPAPEVQRIFWLMRAFLRLELPRLMDQDVRMQFIGRRDRLAPAVLRSITESEAATCGGRRLHLRLAVDYSSREAIARAALALAQGCSSGSTPWSEAAGPFLGSQITAGSGEVDLLIRTGGEKRLSDFLLWESAYAELLFTDRMWPEFNGDDLECAVREFRGRERRFGALPITASETLSATGA